jgi:mono/diheme cytochrome c family protein
MKMKLFARCAAICLLVASAAHAGDSDAGRRLAQLRCVACHVVDQAPRNEVADAPPFVTVGRKFDFNYDSLVLALLGPHRKMNFSLTKRDADDVAAYIAALAR